MHQNYTMLITWSEADRAFLVQFPELQSVPPWAWVCDGTTYQEAAKNGQKALLHILETIKDLGRSLPAPVTPDVTWMYQKQ